MSKPRHYPAMQAAHKLQGELWYDLPEFERTEPAKVTLETYLTASHLYCQINCFTGAPRLAYVRRRAAQFYEMHYQQPHHQWPEMIRFHSLLEQALLDTMGYDAIDQIDMHLWHDVRLRGAIYQANNPN